MNVTTQVQGFTVQGLTVDGLAKSRKTPSPVIPAKAGIQYFQAVADHLNSGFHRSDDFQGSHLDKNAITYCYYMTLR